MGETTLHLYISLITPSSLGDLVAMESENYYIVYRSAIAAILALLSYRLGQSEMNFEGSQPSPLIVSMFVEFR